MDDKTIKYCEGCNLPIKWEDITEHAINCPWVSKTQRFALERKMHWRVFFAWYDFWIGIFYDRKKRKLYICPLPMIVFEYEIRGTLNERKEIRNTGNR